MTLPYLNLSFIQGEEWRSIPGYEGYEASDLGRIRRTTSRTCGKAGAILRQAQTGNGYLTVSPSVNGKKKQASVHRLVALTFLPREAGRDVVNHINNTPTDNRLPNLQWCSPGENVLHSFKTGRNTRAGESNNQSKLIWREVERIRIMCDMSPRLSYEKLGKIFGITSSTVRSIHLGKTWIKSAANVAGEVVVQ